MPSVTEAMRAQIAGGMLHLATDKLDRGPIISYYTVPLDDTELSSLWSDLLEKRTSKSLDAIICDEGEELPLFKAIRERQFAREAPLLIVTLTRLSDRRLQIVKDGLVSDGVLCRGGVCLNDAVETFLRDHMHGLTPGGATSA